MKKMWAVFLGVVVLLSFFCNAEAKEKEAKELDVSKVVACLEGLTNADPFDKETKKIKKALSKLEFGSSLPYGERKKGVADLLKRCKQSLKELKDSGKAAEKEEARAIKKTKKNT